MAQVLSLFFLAIPNVRQMQIKQREVSEDGLELEASTLVGKYSETQL